jgi:hypothetical protein
MPKAASLDPRRPTVPHLPAYFAAPRRAIALASIAVPPWLLALGGDPPPVAPAAGDASCRLGFVPRQARPDDQVCVGRLSAQRVALENGLAASRRDPLAPPGSATCRQGLVWRQAFDGDTTCVSLRSRKTVLEENALAALEHGSIRQAAAGGRPPIELRATAATR